MQTYLRERNQKIIDLMEKHTQELLLKPQWEIREYLRSLLPDGYYDYDELDDTPNIVRGYD